MRIIILPLLIESLMRIIMKFKLLVVGILFLITPTLLSAQKNSTYFEIKGKITDSVNHKSIPDVLVFSQSNGVKTNANGEFILSLPVGSHLIHFELIGYYSKTLNIDVKNNIQLENINLTSKDVQLGFLVVSASKHEQKLEEVTVSMEIIQPKLFQNKNITSIDEGLQQAPGVAIVDDEPQIRSGSGYSFGAGSRVQVLIDDIPILSGDAGKASWAFLPIENIAQVEIIKGASSVLYGSSALSGVIHFRTAYATNQPITKFQSWYGMYQAPKGNRHYWKGNGQKNGLYFSHSERKGQWDWLIATTIQGDDGALGPVKDSLGNVASYDHNPYTLDRYDGENRSRLNFQLRNRVKSIPGLSWGINTIMAHSESNATMIWENINEGLYSSYKGSTTQGVQVLSTIDPFIEYYGKKGNRHTFKSRWQSLDNYNNNQQGNFSDVYYTEYQYQQDWENWGVPQLTSTFGVVNSYTDARGQIFTGGNANGENTAKNQAAYLQLDGKIKKNFTYSLGCRYEQFTVNNEKQGRPVFRSGVNYALGKATYLRASYGQGYRFPSIAEKFVVTALGAIKIFANPDIKAETSDNMEIGLKQGFKIGEFKGFVDLAAFQQRFENFIEFTFGQWGPDPNLDNMLGFGFKSLNTGKAQVRGAEASIMGTGKINEKWSLDILTGYTYTQPVSKTPDYQYAQQDSVNIYFIPVLAKPSYMSTSSNTNGNILKYRMQHLFRWDVGIRREKWSVGTSFRYNSHMQNIDVAFEELESQFPSLFNPGIQQWRNSHLKGDFVIDARIGYQFKNSSLSLVVNNALNRLYSIRPLALEDPRNFAIQYSITL
jgi:outer membrane cobalamin receptor